MSHVCPFLQEHYGGRPIEALKSTLYLSLKYKESLSSLPSRHLHITLNQMDALQVVAFAYVYQSTFQAAT